LSGWLLDVFVRLLLLDIVTNDTLYPFQRLSKRRARALDEKRLSRDQWVHETSLAVDATEC
jgi:hypothetical protein